MKRRALLSAVAAGGLAGCLTGQPTPQTVGIDERRVDAARCGTVIGRPCGLATGVRNDIDRPILVRARLGGAVTVYRATDRLVVRGYILGNGDPNCREARVSTVELAGGTFSVSVHNDTDYAGRGCTDEAAAVHYRVAAGVGESAVDRVRVRHYSDEGEVILSGAVDAPRD